MLHQCLKLGSKHELIAGDRIKERFLTDAIPGKEKCPPWSVPHGKGEHATEMPNTFRSVLLVRMNDDLGITVRRKRMA